VDGDPDDRWETGLVGGRGPWRTALRLIDRVELRPRPALTLDTATSADDWVVSRFGTIAAADVAIDGAVALRLFRSTAPGKNGRRPKVMPTAPPTGFCRTFPPSCRDRTIVSWSLATGTCLAATASTETRTGGPDMTPSSSAPRPSD
jgi:hypothetical protein